MRFYDIIMKGKLILEKLASSPSFNSANEGRVFYHTGDKNIYFNDDTKIGKIWTENNTSDLTTELVSSGNFGTMAIQDSTSVLITGGEVIVDDVSPGEAKVTNVYAGTGSPPTASTVPEGTLFIKYVA